MYTLGRFHVLIKRSWKLFAAMSAATVFITMLGETNNQQEVWEKVVRQTSISSDNFKTIFQEQVLRNKPKILVWTTFFGSMDWYENGRNEFDNASDCSLTNNKSEIRSADAVVFHLSDITWIGNLLNGLRFKFPSFRRPDQVWALYNLEPITMVLGNLRAWQGVFNWTWSYRKDSDVYTPYGQFKKLANSEANKKKSERHTMKNYDYFSTRTHAGGVAVISNCVDDARRYMLIESLRKFIAIDVYGKCGISCPEDKSSCDNLKGSYQFYLALENSDCRDYVTEKYWSTLMRNQIPIVAWKLPMDHLVIPKSYINLYDFKDLDTAGAYIKRVGENRTLYNSYFDWKRTYKQTFSLGFSTLCEKLRDTTKFSQVYENLDGWLSNSVCHPLTTVQNGFSNEKTTSSLNPAHVSDSFNRKTRQKRKQIRMNENKENGTTEDNSKKRKLKINRFLTKAASLRKRATDERIKSERSSQSSVSNKTDHPCSPCLREKKIIESTSFCKDCNEKLCQQCVQFHKKFQVLRTHTIVNLVEHLAVKEEKKIEKKQVHKVDVRCKHHHGKLIEMYCPEHDEVGCKVCMAVNHKSCTKPEYVVDKCEGVSHGHELMGVKKDLHSVKIQIADLKLQRKTDLKRLTQEKDKILNTLTEFRKTVNDILDKLEKEIKNKLHAKFDDDSTFIRNDITKCEEMVEKMEGLLEKLRLGPESHTFVYMKADARSNLRAGEKLATSIMGHLGREAVHFTIDEEIRGWFRDFSYLGRFDHELGSYTGALVGDFELLLESDSVKTDCVYNGSAAIPDNRSYRGRTVVTDWKNKRLKLLDKSYKVTAHCDVTSVPYGVCSVDSGNIIVSLRDEKLFQFFTVDHRLRPGRKFKIDQFCRGIAYHNEEIYVACGGGAGEDKGQLRIYNMTGELVRVVDEDIHGKPIFSSPKDIAINNDGTRIYVSDRDRGVIALNKNGKVKYIFKDPALKTAFGICTNEKDELFVTGYDSSNVIHLGPNGKILGEVLTASEGGIEKPISMCSHENPTSRLLITTELSNVLHVYELLET